MFKIQALSLFFCGLVSIGFAQDSVKKTPAVKKVVPAATPAPGAYNKYKPHTYYNKYKAAGTTPAATTTATLPVTTPAPVKVATVPPAAPVNFDKSLNGQYQYLLTKIYHYQQPFVSEFWRNANDTLTANRNKLKAALSKLPLQQKIIDSLKADVTSKEQTLNQSNARVDSVSLLGIPLSKSTYNLIMWGLVVVFGLTAGIVLARSGSYSREAKHRIQLYNELEEEFKTYKAKANDKEKKLARELQTERNKIDELLGRG